MLRICQHPGCYAPADWDAIFDGLWYCGPCIAIQAVNRCLDGSEGGNRMLELLGIKYHVPAPAPMPTISRLETTGKDLVKDITEAAVVDVPEHETFTQAIERRFGPRQTTATCAQCGLPTHPAGANTLCTV